MTDNENPVHMFAITIVFGAIVGLIVMFLAFQREARESEVELRVVPEVTVAPTTPPTLPSGQDVLEGIGGAAGDVYADATSPEAKETYRNIGEGVSDGWNTVKDSFNRSVEANRQGP
jgi:hypothetical protein